VSTAVSTMTGGSAPARFAHDLEQELLTKKSDGRKLLVAYLTGGMRPDWLDLAEALVAGGADALEVGLPFSDPMIDGPVIQQASLAALRRASTPLGVIAELKRAQLGVPSAVMSYYNLVLRAGLERMAGAMADAGVSGAIVPDLPLEESAPWRLAASREGVATVLLVAPSTPLERAERICRASRGFVYAAGLMGVTGERSELARSASEMGTRLSVLTDLPVLVGIGISTPEQAARAAASSAGVVVGSAFVRRALEGAAPADLERLARSFREALDRVD